MTKNKSIFITLLLSFFVFAISNTLMVPEVFANTDTHRIAGSNRYETAANIAKEGWSNGSDWAILAYGGNFPDALAATPLATKYDAPILLTASQSLTPITKTTLVDLGVQNVIIVGGTGVVSPNIESQLKAMGISTQRIAGDNRYETSLAIASQVAQDFSQIVVTTGEDFSSALSISSFAGNKNIPIILVNKNYITENAKKFLSSNNIDKSYIIGNSYEISESVKNLFPNAVRIYGNDKYATNLAVINSPEFGYNLSSIFLATGNDFADALAGSAYAARTNSPILLVSKTTDSRITNFFTHYFPEINQLNILGGEGAVSASLVSNYIKPSTTTYSSRDIFNKVSPSVVYIETYDAYGRIFSSGSGFVIDSNGKIATNYHVLDGAYTANVKTSNGEIYSVQKVLAYDQTQDMVLIKIDGSGLTPVKLGNSDKIETGDKIYTIGSPFGLENTISDGLISTNSRFINGVNLIQISAPISPGSSGGALVNELGEVIGITSSGITEGQNLNFAIPINALKPMLSQDIDKTLAEINPQPTNSTTPSQPTQPVYSAFFPELSTVPMPISQPYDFFDYSTEGDAVFYYYSWYNDPITFYEDYIYLLSDYGWTYYDLEELSGSTEVYYTNNNQFIGISISPQYMVIYGFIH